MRVKKGTSMLQRKAGEVKRYRIYKKIIPICMTCIALLAAIVYVISVLYTRFGSFTVKVDKYNQLDYGLSLSETSDFAKPTSMLDCKASKVITNIDGNTLPEDLGANDGEDNGENYMCYTFYCKNTGKKTVTFDYSIQIITMTLNIDKAVRIRQITSLNGGAATKVDYARAWGVDPETNAQIPEEGTVPFREKSTVAYSTVEDFKKDDVMKYTIVIWLEGNDKDCVDNIIGGEFKIDMKFQVLSGAE